MRDIVELCGQGDLVREDQDHHVDGGGGGGGSVYGV